MKVSKAIPKSDGMEEGIYYLVKRDNHDFFFFKDIPYSKTWQVRPITRDISVCYQNNRLSFSKNNIECPGLHQSHVIISKLSCP